MAEQNVQGWCDEYEEIIPNNWEAPTVEGEIPDPEFEAELPHPEFDTPDL